jgi:hypothetical protein
MRFTSSTCPDQSACLDSEEENHHFLLFHLRLCHNSWKISYFSVFFFFFCFFFFERVEPASQCTKYPCFCKLPYDCYGRRCFSVIFPITRDRGKKAALGEGEAQSTPVLHHGESIWSFHSFNSFHLCPDNRYRRVLLPTHVLLCSLSAHTRTWGRPTARLAILGYCLPSTSCGPLQ